MLEYALTGLLPVMVLMFGVWLLSLPLRDVSIVDAFWGPAVAAAGFTWYLVHPLPPIRGVLVLVLVAIWAARLAVYVVWRNWGQPEDRRYREIRQRNEPNFSLKSLYLVFGLQAVLAWLIAMPIYGAMLGGSAVWALDGLGVLVVMVGLGIETLADLQLARFLRRPDAETAVMDQGLWRLSRHPNYFGECLFWWGIWLIAAAGNAWWTVFAPVLMTFLLLRVSGVALTEKSIKSRRPGYDAYVSRTSAFIPWPPR